MLNFIEAAMLVYTVQWKHIQPSFTSYTAGQLTVFTRSQHLKLFLMKKLVEHLCVNVAEIEREQERGLSSSVAASKLTSAGEWRISVNETMGLKTATLPPSPSTTSAKARGGSSANQEAGADRASRNGRSSVGVVAGRASVPQAAAESLATATPGAGAGAGLGEIDTVKTSAQRKPGLTSSVSKHSAGVALNSVATGEKAKRAAAAVAAATGAYGAVSGSLQKKANAFRSRGG